VSGPPALERSYRRLLAWYPRGFRREHEEEVLAVLLAGARPGQRRPGLAEAANLIISGLGARLRRRWVIAAALPCAAATAVLGYALTTPQGYTATAAVLAAPTGTGQTQQTPAGAVVQMATVNLDTEAELVTSATVTMLAAHLMHSSLLATQLSSGVTVAVPPNSAVLDITCHAPTAAAAATCANAFAKAYVQTKNRTASWQAHGIGDVIITPARP
jgi:capsular polysaccharide biosynthesis protein